MIVDDWREIGVYNLRLWHAEHSGAFSKPEVQERLTNGYWIARMRRILARMAAGRRAATEAANAKSRDPQMARTVHMTFACRPKIGAIECGPTSNTS